jgi:hypothetical protein
MTFAFARVGAVTATRRGNHVQAVVGAAGGKRREMPVHHNLEAYMNAYIDVAGIRDDGKASSFARPLAVHATGITGYFEARRTLENAQAMAACAAKLVIRR